MDAGVPLPARVQRSRAKAPAPVPDTPKETAALWAWLAEHGRDIAAILIAAGGEAGQLATARAHRDVVRGDPGAHERWLTVLREVGL